MLLRKEILLPEVIGDGRLDSLLTAFFLLKNFPDKIYTFNWRRVKKILPTGHAILACLADAIAEQNIKVKHLFIKNKFKAYPEIKKLLNLPLSLPKPSEYNFFDSSNILRGNETSIDILFMEDTISNFRTILSEDLIFYAKLVTNELMQNCVDHASAERYYLYAGIDGNDFCLGVLDMGVSIPAKLEQKYHCKTDTEYLALAFKIGISTRRQRTGGLGLNHTFEILKETQGRLTILSRDAQIRRYFRHKKILKNKLKHRLQGTWCFMRFKIDENK